MSKRRGIFSLIWLAIWTLGAFVAVTQLWLLPENPPLVQFLLLAGLALMCCIAWLITAWSIVSGLVRANDRN